MTSPAETEPKMTSLSPARRVKVSETWLSFSTSDWKDLRSISTFFFRAWRSISIVLTFVAVTARAIFRGMR